MQNSEDKKENKESVFIIHQSSNFYHDEQNSKKLFSNECKTTYNKHIQKKRQRRSFSAPASLNDVRFLSKNFQKDLKKLFPKFLTSRTALTASDSKHKQRINTELPTNIFNKSHISCLMRKIPSDFLSETGCFLDISAPESVCLNHLAKLFSFSWDMGFVSCKVVYYMQTFSAVCSVLTLTAMSIERYYAIAHPMRAQYVCTISQASKIIIGTWISASLLAIPVLFVQVHTPVGTRISAFWCVRDFESEEVLRAHELYMLFLILIIPTGVMGVAYTSICLEVWEVTQKREGLTGGRVLSVRLKRNPCLTTSSSFSMTYMNNFSSKSRLRKFFYRQPEDETPVKQVIKMLVAVVVIYVLCWGPMLVENLLVAYNIIERFPKGNLKYMRTAFQLMAYFNSCINPVIYGFMSKNFRESFRNTLCCRPDVSKIPARSYSISQTRNSSIRYAESSLGRTVSLAVPD